MDKIEQNNQIIEIVKELLGKMGFEAGARLVEGGFEGSSFPVLSIESDNDLSMLIGKNGQNLNALEHLIRLIIFRKNGDQNQNSSNFAVDINDYRKSRTKYILETAKNAVSRVVASQRAEALAPMSSYERRIVHTELASCKDIHTESIGEEPRRRIVIKPLII
jgi:spoIIIJ-associated protein